MADYFAQSVLQAATGNSRDNQVNTWALGGIPAMDLGIATAWLDAVKAFYDDVQALGALKGILQSGHLFKVYEITAVQPNYPKFEFSWALTIGPIATDLPQEVALAVSYRNTAATTIARARRRGRIYISGWGETENLAGRPRIATVEGLADAYTLYADTMNADAGGLEAGVWSRAEGQVYPIQEVWCDNEWDTMRSRGGRSTQRFVNPVVPA
jgi:hypothetical protein